MSTFTSKTDQILVSLENRVATITLNRPEARNALSPELSAGLREAIQWASTDDEVGAVLLTGAGSAFCSGGDVKAMSKRNEGGTTITAEMQFRDLQARHHGIGGALVAMRKPTIAALPGPAAGAGLALALACDIRIGADNALLTTGYAAIGLSGDYGIAWLLTRVVGPAKARQLMLTSERLQAPQAMAVGLLNEVVSGETLQIHATEFAARLAQGPTVAYSYIKDNLDEALSIDHATAIDREADRLLKARTTQDHKEAVQAFAEKRAPKFTGI
ncbi:MAG: enoyl-CoA hydratase [Pseudomonadales bacterium]|nr:enoyl-CoA hydratase [Pseudomonadales bacterium]